MFEGCVYKRGGGVEASLDRKKLYQGLGALV